MFGVVMHIKGKTGLSIKLGPITKEDAAVFIKNGGLQHHSVSRYLGLNQAPTLEDEHDWYEKVRTSKSEIAWGVWVREKDDWKLIGTSSLRISEKNTLKQGVTGSLIVDKSYWGRGIASDIHQARTWYAFKQLGMIRLKSAVLLPNIGSRKALSRSGYFHVNLERNETFIDGQFQHMENLECLNPSELFWQRWWGEDKPTKAALEARKVTESCMAWAEENVQLL